MGENEWESIPKTVPSRRSFVDAPDSLSSTDGAGWLPENDGPLVVLTSEEASRIAHMVHSNAWSPERACEEIGKIIRPAMSAAAKRAVVLRERTRVLEEALSEIDAVLGSAASPVERIWEARKLISSLAVVAVEDEAAKDGDGWPDA